MLLPIGNIKWALIEVHFASQVINYLAQPKGKNILIYSDNNKQNILWAKSKDFNSQMSKLVVIISCANCINDHGVCRSIVVAIIISYPIVYC